MAAHASSHALHACMHCLPWIALEWHAVQLSAETVTSCAKLRVCCTVLHTQQKHRTCTYLRRLSRPVGAKQQIQYTGRGHGASGRGQSRMTPSGVIAQGSYGQADVTPGSSCRCACFMLTSGRSSKSISFAWLSSIIASTVVSLECSVQ